MESPKITVIVPVYNVAAYIEKCAISLFQQTLDSLEILFIDDNKENIIRFNNMGIHAWTPEEFEQLI